MTGDPSVAAGRLSLLRLLQLFDSQFPIGAFAHSGGIETYASLEAGFDRHGLRELMVNQLRYGWGRLDLAAAALAWGACRDSKALEALAAEVESFRVIPGPFAASLKIGRRLLILAARLYPREIDGLHLDRPHQPVVTGAIAARLGVGQEEMLTAFAQAACAASVTAATRAMSLSPEQAQEILVALQPEIVRAVDRVLANPEAQFFAATPGLDIRAHQQAFLHTRLFQS